MNNIAKFYSILFAAFLLIQSAQTQILISESARGNHWNVPSDNGTKTAYIKLTQKIEDYYAKVNQAELIIADFNGKNEARMGLFLADSHDDVLFRWIDDSLFTCRPYINIGNINTKRINRISNVGPYPVSYNKRVKLILTGQYKYQKNRYADVWTVDPYSGKETKILDANVFLPFVNKFKIAKTTYSKDPKNWRIFHRYFNPSGSLIWIKLTVPASDKKNAEETDYAFTFDIKGKDIVFFGEGPTHPAWWNDETIFNNQDGKLYYRDGAYTGNQISGFCNHPAISPDKRFIVGDSDYESDPVKLFLYRAGNVEPIAVLHTSDYPGPIWDLRYHVNPSFSLDGKNVFYSMSTAKDNVGYFRYDISDYLDYVSDSLLVKYDFDNDTASPDSWELENSPGLISEIAEIPSIYDKSLFLKDNSDKKSAVAVKKFQSQRGRIEISFDALTTDNGSWQAFILKNKDVNAIETYFVNGNIRYRNINNNDVNISVHEAMEWTHLKYDIDVARGKYSIYINGLLIARDIIFSKNINNVDQILFKSGNQGTGGLYADNITVIKKNSSFSANKTVPWIEDFSGGKWLSKGDQGGTSWKTDIRHANKEKMADFGINDGAFMFFKTAESSKEDKYLIWKSEFIDIENKNVQISFKLKENENLENTDYVRAYYQVDGKEKISFAEILGNLPENNRWFTFKKDNISGKVLQIFIHSKTDGEKYFLDDVSVLEEEQ